MHITATMQFIAQPPAMSLAAEANGAYACFVAEWLNARPPWADMATQRHEAKTAQDLLQAQLARRAACPIEALGFFMDEAGGILICKMSKAMQTNNARSAVRTILGGFPADLRSGLLKAFRPMDQLDKERVDSWEVASSLLPASYVDDDDEHDDDEEGVYPVTLEGWEDFSRAWDAAHLRRPEGVPMRLCIADGEVDITVSQQDLAEVGLSTMDIQLWKETCKRRAVVVAACVGDLQVLSYTVCKHELRRAQLIASRLTRRSELVDAAECAAKLAAEGALPSALADGGRSRRAEFMRRCASAVAMKNAEAETKEDKLCAEHRLRIAVALGEGSKLCLRCSKPAKSITNFAPWFPVEGQSQGSEDLRAYCNDCQPARVWLCPQCGKDDAMEYHLVAASDPHKLLCTRCCKIAICKDSARMAFAYWEGELMRRG